MLVDLATQPIISTPDPPNAIFSPGLHPPATLISNRAALTLKICSGTYWQAPSSLETLLLLYRLFSPRGPTLSKRFPSSLEYGPLRQGYLDI